MYAQSMRVEVDYLTKGKERPGESFEINKLLETLLRDFLYQCFTGMCAPIIYLCINLYLFMSIYLLYIYICIYAA